MAISLGPIASGLPKDIVERLLEVERRPLIALENRKKNEEDRLALVNDLSKRINSVGADLAAFGRYKQFRELGSTIGRPDLMDVTINKEEAEPGDYQLEIVQLAGRSSMLSNGFEDPDNTQIGVGYFSYDLPNGDTKEVFIGEDENTLQGIAKKINRQRDLNLHAIVVDDGTGSDNPWRLIISHKQSGEINDAEFPEFYFVDGDEDFFLEQERPAQNSVVKLNGFNVEFPGTKVDTLLPGVIMDLKDSDPGKEFNFRIFEDRVKIEGKIKALVEKINGVFEFVQKQNQLDETSNTSNTLGGDVTIQNVENMLRRTIMTPLETSEGSIRLGEMGIQFNRNGLLEVNDARLKKVLNERFESVAEFFTGINDRNDGFVAKVTKDIKNYTQNGGVVFSRQEGIKQRIKDIDRQIANTEKNVENAKRTLEQKFSQLESAMARLKGQQQQVQGALGGGGGIMDNLKLS